MFKRKIKVLGKSIPVSVILLLLVTITALALFLNVLIGSVSLSAMDGPAGDWYSPSCAVASGPGTIDTCTLDGSAFTVSGSGFSNDSVITAAVSYKSTAGNQVYSFVPPAPLPDAISLISVDVPEGYIAVQDAGNVLITTITLGNLTAGETVPAFEFKHTFASQ